MKSFRANPLLRSRLPLAIGAGLLWTAAFPNVGIAGFAWIAPGMMVAAALGTKGGETFRVGYVAGLTHYLSMLYWLLLIPYRWHGLPLGPALGWLALGAFLALFPAAWVWIANPKAPASSSVKGLEGDAQEGLGRLLPRNWVLRLVWGVSGAAAWVALEMVLARIFGGFPWDLLGVSQYRMTPLIQLSAWTGVYGLSFLAVWVSLSFVAAGLMVIQRPTARSVWVAEVCLPVLVVALLFNLGFRHLRNQETAQPRSVKFTLVQPSIPQTLIWDSTKDAERFQELLRLSEFALTNRTEVLVWPESAVPKLLRYDKETFEAVTSLARRHQVWMILGADDAEPRLGATDREQADYFNSSFLISPEGKIMERYEKRNLVMFGEYVPLARWLPFLKYLTPIEGGFRAGTKAVPFHLDNLKTTAQVLICFEDTFPHLARQELTFETDVLINLTNDGWFGEGAAQWQQAATGLFRAIENNRPLIRCANNGLTCWVDEHGILRDIFRDADGRVYGKGFLTAAIPLPPEGVHASLTFYTRHGDWFGWGCMVVAVLVVGWRLIRPKLKA